MGTLAQSEWSNSHHFHWRQIILAILQTIGSHFRAMVHCFLQECGLTAPQHFYRLYGIRAEMILLLSMLRRFIEVSWQWFTGTYGYNRIHITDSIYMVRHVKIIKFLTNGLT